MTNHDRRDLESEVNRLLSSVKFEDIRRYGIKTLCHYAEEQYKKTLACFQIDV